MQQLSPPLQQRCAGGNDNHTLTMSPKKAACLPADILLLLLHW